MQRHREPWYIEVWNPKFNSIRFTLYQILSENLNYFSWLSFKFEEHRYTRIGNHLIATSRNLQIAQIVVLLQLTWQYRRNLRGMKDVIKEYGNWVIIKLWSWGVVVTLKFDYILITLEKSIAWTLVEFMPFTFNINYKIHP